MARAVARYARADPRLHCRVSSPGTPDLQPFELFIGLRYTRAKRRNHFISVIALISMLGIALGVMALIVVLSVMNGFQKELRARILGVASHVQISGVGNRLVPWREVMQQAQNHPDVIAAAPFVMAQSMLSFGSNVQGAVIRGIDPAAEAKVADVGRHMKAGSLDLLKPGEFGIVLGAELARALAVRPGETVVLIAAQGQVTPAGILPRLRQFRVVGIFEVGMYEYDFGLAYINIEDAQRLYRMGDAISGVRLRLDDLMAAPRVAREIAMQLPPETYVVDWTRSHANFFRAVEIEKRVMFIILTLIVAVATFNIVSALVMAVTDKQADIAILRTLGAAPRSVMKIFMVQGALMGVFGTLAGVAAGIVLALNIDVVVPFIEQTFGIRFLAKDVYYISDLPSDLQWHDVVVIASVSLVLTLAATLYPSWRAARVNPAEALRYE
ncbi:MAG: lipoprotein-releasing ABC transporter permease subunit [Burkholderiales bacterium]|nr:lipoprotein-releasing ABC transporter permease subunit [Burkholderiales bacterium]